MLDTQMPRNSQRDECEKLRSSDEKKIEQLEKENAELRKKHTKGEINEAYAQQIERDKDVISKLKAKVNKLEQNKTKLEKENAELRHLEVQNKINVEVINEKDATIQELAEAVKYLARISGKTWQYEALAAKYLGGK